MSRFQPATLRKLAWSIGLVSVILLLGSFVFMVADRNAALPSDLRSWSLSNLVNFVANLAVPVMGIILATRRSRNPIGWLFLVAGLSLALGAFGQSYAVHALRVDPGSLPAGRLFGWIANWTWPIAITMLVFLLLLFPDGRLRSRRWRPVGWVTGATGAGLFLGSLLAATMTWSRPLSQADPTTVGGTAGVLITIPFLIALAAWPVTLVAAFVSVVLRYRSSTGEERLQLKWFATAAGVVAVAFAAMILSGNNTPAFLSIASALSTLFLYVAIGVAVLRYRLYEIDVVIGKTVMFAVLAAFITIVYVALVIGVGTLVGNSRSPLLSAVAAAVVAVAFQPVRERARRVANRVVYGKRATPYECCPASPNAPPRPTPPTMSCRASSASWPKGSARTKRGSGCRSATSCGRPRRGRRTGRCPRSRSTGPTGCPASPSASAPSPFDTRASSSVRSASSRRPAIRSVPIASGSSRTSPRRPRWSFGTSG